MATQWKSCPEPAPSSVTAPPCRPFLWSAFGVYCTRPGMRRWRIPVSGSLPQAPIYHIPINKTHAHRRSLTICGARFWCKWAYKPGSVLDSHLSRRDVAGTLQPPPRRRPGRPCVSSTVLLRIEFTASDCSQPPGELLPRLSTLTSRANDAIGDAQSASLHSDGQQLAVYLCCTFPEVAFGGRYPLSLPYGARTFLTLRPLGLCARLSSPLA